MHRKEEEDSAEYVRARVRVRALELSKCILSCGETVSGRRWLRECREGRGGSLQFLNKKLGDDELRESSFGNDVCSRG